MHQYNFMLVMVAAALVPLLLCFVWYHPKVFGSAWMKAGGFDENKMKEGFNMPLVFGLTLFLGFLMAFALSGEVIHQLGFTGMLMHGLQAKDPATLAFYKQGIDTYGMEFRNFHHGVIHGAICGIGIGLTVIAVNGMFERKSFKYIMINAGFWIVCMILMGGIISTFADINGFSA